MGGAKRNPWLMTPQPYKALKWAQEYYIRLSFTLSGFQTIRISIPGFHFVPPWAKILHPLWGFFWFPNAILDRYE